MTVLAFFESRTGTVPSRNQGVPAAGLAGSNTRLEQVQVTSSALSFTLTGEPNRLYWIEVSTNLVDWTGVFGYGGGPTVISTGNYPWRFFRARTDP